MCVGGFWWEEMLSVVCVMSLGVLLGVWLEFFYVVVVWKIKFGKCTGLVKMIKKKVTDISLAFISSLHITIIMKEVWFLDTPKAKPPHPPHDARDTTILPQFIRISTYYQFAVYWNVIQYCNHVKNLAEQKWNVIYEMAKITLTSQNAMTVSTQVWLLMWYLKTASTKLVRRMHRTQGSENSKITMKLKN